MASAAWSARNARARAAGYRNYYDYRAHNYGRRKPDEPQVSGEELARLRGHRSEADLERLLESGRIELVSTQTTVDERGKVGVDVAVFLDDGSQRIFRITFRQAKRFGDLLDDLGPEAPLLAGSPRTLKRFQDIDDEEFDEAEDADDELEAAA